MVNKEQLNAVLHLVVRSFLPSYLSHNCCSVLYWMLQFWAAKGAGGDEIEHIKKKEEIKPWLLSEDMIICIRILPKFAKYLLEYILFTSTKYVDTPSINLYQNSCKIFIDVSIRNLY